MNGVIDKQSNTEDNLMNNFEIAGRKIGGNNPCYIIAEISCNHEGDLEEAKKIIRAVAKAGADAAKIQTYTADTICRNFKIVADSGTMWDGMDYYDLYDKAHTPWEWHGELQKVADECGIHLFSTPFDESAVDFLEKMDTPVYKVASFELVDTKLLEKVAKTGKPVIISTGMATYLEIDEAIRVLKNNGAKNIAVLHCNSGYPTPHNECNLKTIPFLKEQFGLDVGLSDHTMFADHENLKNPVGYVAGVEAVKMGAKIIEIHVTMDRQAARKLNEKNEGGFDWAFSKEPSELKKMVDMIRQYEKTGNIEYETSIERDMARIAVGQISTRPLEKEKAAIVFRPALWVVEDIKKGETLKFAGGYEGNVDSIRPGQNGLHIRFADNIDGKKAACDIKAGTPLSWEMVLY